MTRTRRCARGGYVVSGEWTRSPVPWRPSSRASSRFSPLARLVFRVDAPALSSNSRMSSRVLTLPHGANHDSYASLDTPQSIDEASNQRLRVVVQQISVRDGDDDATKLDRLERTSRGERARDNASTIAFSARVGRPPS